MLRDIKSSLGLTHILDAASRAAGTHTSSLVPVTSGRGLAIALNYGAFVPNTAVAGVSAKLQESDTTVGTDFTDVDAADLNGAFAGILVDASNDQRTEIVGYTGVKKYVRLSVTVPANATSLLCSADAIVMLADKPVAAPDPVAAT